MYTYTGAPRFPHNLPPMTPFFVRNRSLFVAASVVAFAACKESTSPPQPSVVSNGTAVVAEGTVGTVLTTPPTFVVKDDGGKVLSGIPVTITVSAGGGVLTNPPTKTTSGETPVGTWQLGNIAGINSVTVQVAGLAPFVISVNGKAGPPTQLTFLAGQGQSARAGTALPAAITVQAKDKFGNPVGGTPVTFAAIEGGGTVGGNGNPVNTDASGNATSPAWTLGKTANPQTLRASTPSGASATVTATVTTSFNVDLRFFGGAISPAATAAFTNAAARIMGAVIGDVPDIAASATGINIQQFCGLAGLPTAFTEPIDDLLIFASVVPIDGAGGILGRAGPCAIRTGAGPGNNQSVFGVMQFDAVDVDSMVSHGILQDVIQHEMLHVVGIGTLWNTYGVLADAGTTSVRFTGTLGVGACIQIGAASACPSSVPVENSGGAGTRDSHWRESVFANELMTGFVCDPTRIPPQCTQPVPNPFSLISVQSLADVGYQVNPADADPYVVPGTSALRAAIGVAPSQSEVVWETVLSPTAAVDKRGNVTRLPVKQ